MNLEQQFINNIKKIKGSKQKKVDFIKSTIFDDIQQLIDDETENLEQYYNYYYDKLDMANFEAELLIQKEIIKEYEVYTKRLQDILETEGYNELNSEFIRLQAQKKVKDTDTKIISKNIVDKAVDPKRSEILGKSKLHLESNAESILSQIKNLKIK